MKNAFPLFDVLVVCIETFTVYYYLKSWFHKKQNARWQTLTAYLLFGVITGVVSTFCPIMLMIALVTYIAITCVSVFCFQGSMLKLAFASFLLLIIGVASEAVVSLLLSGILNVQLDVLRGHGTDRAVGMLISKMLCLSFVGIISRFLGRQKDYKPHRILRTIPLIFCQFVLMVLLDSVFLISFQGDGAISLQNIFKIIGILFISVFLFTYYDIMASAYEHKYRNQMAQIQLDNHIRHYNSIKEQEGVLISIEHDIEKFMVVMNDLVSDGHKEASLRYKAALDQAVDKHMGFIYKSQPVVSSILNNCLKNANKLGVKVDLDVRIPETLGIEDLDLTVILGNILDNAIEALKSVENKSDRELSVSLVQKDYFVFFEVTNSFNPRFVRTEASRRGYGLRNVKASIQKYGGELTVNKDENRFTATALINAVMPDALP